MGVGSDTIEFLIKLRLSGYLRPRAAVMEIGAQQLANSFLSKTERIAHLGRLFGIEQLPSLPQPKPSHIVHGTIEHLEDTAPVARDFWRWLGFDYAAIDVDGNPDSIPLDLNYDVAPAEMRGKYDLLTNFGTTEHIANQLNAFKVIHDLTAPGGIMIHSLPAQGMLNHGLVNYNLKFFSMLARSNGYRFLHVRFSQGSGHYQMPSDMADFVDSIKLMPDVGAEDDWEGSARDLRVCDAGILVIWEKPFDIPFVPPIDVPSGASTSSAALSKRYWTVFEPQAFERQRPHTRDIANVICASTWRWERVLAEASLPAADRRLVRRRTDNRFARPQPVRRAGKERTVGIGGLTMEGLIREAMHRPFSGTAYTLGRATMGLPVEETNARFRQIGLTPVGGFARADQVDTITTASSGFGFQPIRDTEFFRMLGFDELKVIDISDYEGAEIIFDLNKEVPQHLAGTCDLLVDASTLDNVFDPVTALRNAAKLLKPTGRICMNAQTTYCPHWRGIPYLNIAPMWLYDWFTINRFVDCQVYVSVWTPPKWTQSTYMFDHKYATREYDGGIVRPVASEFLVTVSVFAERDENSTCDRIPTQHEYRPAAEWQDFESVVRSFIARRREPHQRSSEATAHHVVPAGWLRVLPNWALEEPATGRMVRKVG